MHPFYQKFYNLTFDAIKQISDVKTRRLFVIIFEDLIYVLHANQKNTQNYLTDLNALINGYTPKRFKRLRKLQKDKSLNMMFLQKYVDLKILWSEKKINTLDDLLNYALASSPMMFLLLVYLDDDKLDISHLKYLAYYDILSFLLIHAQMMDDLLPQFPSRLVFDYHIEKDFDNRYIINDAFIYLWETLGKYALEAIDSLNQFVHLLPDNIETFLIQHMKIFTYLIKYYRQNIKKAHLLHGLSDDLYLSIKKHKI